MKPGFSERSSTLDVGFINNEVSGISFRSKVNDIFNQFFRVHSQCTYIIKTALH